MALCWSLERGVSSTIQAVQVVFCGTCGMSLLYLVSCFRAVCSVGCVETVWSLSTACGADFRRDCTERLGVFRTSRFMKLSISAWPKIAMQQCTLPSAQSNPNATRRVHTEALGFRSIPRQSARLRSFGLVRKEAVINYYCCLLLTQCLIEAGSQRSGRPCQISAPRLPRCLRLSFALT